MELMSQYELYDLAISLRGEASSTTGLFLTVVSGYLAIAYIVGTSLTRAQVTIITGIFLVFTITQMAGHYSTMLELGALSEDIKRLQPNLQRMDMWAALFLFINSSIVLASLKFMWDIRRSQR